MPSRVGKSANPRFELPALNLNFGSITDGTNIPPPPASPTKNVSSPPQTAQNQEEKALGGIGNLRQDNGNTSRTEHTVAGGLLTSPTPLPDNALLGIFFNRNKLNSEFTESSIPTSNSAPALQSERPQSRGGFSLMGDRKSKRSSGWFKRLRTGDQQPSRRSSFLFSSGSAPATKPSSTPPPMIPELKELERDGGSLGTDIFKNIRNTN